MGARGWSIKEKIGQMFIIAFGGEEMSTDLEKAIVDLNVGGVILFQRNLRDVKKVVQLIKDIQQTAIDHERPPLWISIDQEGGGIAYLWDGMIISPGNMLISASGNEKHAYDASYIMGLQLKQIGFNMNFAPVIDINNNPKNPVIGARSYSESAEVVSRLGQQSVQGYHDAGILAVGKHFPGHGDTAFDSHLSLPKVDKDLKELEQFELIPFIENFKRGMEAIMTAHIIYPALDLEYPATLSAFFLKRLLRDKYQFDGLIITDSMEMHAISKYFGREAGSVKAAQAGADIILACGKDVASQQVMIEAVEKAVLTGEIDEVIIDTAVDRILKFKDKWINSSIFDKKEIDYSFLKQESFHKTMDNIALDGITLQFDRDRLVPLPKKAKIKVISQTTYNDENYIGDRKSIVHKVFSEDRYELNYITRANPTSSEIEQISESVKPQQDVVLLINERRELDRTWLNLYEKIKEKTVRVIVVSLWNPQIVASFPEDLSTYITTYSYTDHAIKQLKCLLEGQQAFKGKSPVRLLEKESISHE